MKSTYKEKVVKPPSTAQLTKIAAELGYDLGGADIQEFKGTVAVTSLALQTENFTVKRSPSRTASVLRVFP